MGKLEVIISLIEGKEWEKLKKIDLSGCQLTEFPKELFELSDIAEMINLGDNELTSLPEEIGTFSKLKILFFANNKFTSIPLCLGKLPNLYMLSFKSNQIEMIAEEALSSAIGWLILTDNKLKELPQNIGINCPKLKKFMLAGNQLTTLPESMSSLKELELLRIAGNQFESFPDWLFNLPKLSWLALAGNPIFLHSKIDNNAQEIDWNSFQTFEILGEGASGIVYRGKWNQKIIGETSTGDEEWVDVAVKVFKSGSTSDGYPEDEMRASTAVDHHPSGIRVFGKIANSPNNSLGLVLSLIPAHYYTLGGSPSFDSVTRDVYKADQKFTFKFALNVLKGVSSLAQHLHSNNISHGDLYAHNTLVHEETGFPLLGDFGAATIYDVFDIRQRAKFQALEVRAFGCLIEDMITRLSDEDDSNRRTVSMLKEVMTRCFAEVPVMRPSFRDIVEMFNTL